MCNSAHSSLLLLNMEAVSYKRPNSNNGDAQSSPKKQRRDTLDPVVLVVHPSEVTPALYSAYYIDRKQRTPSAAVYFSTPENAREYVTRCKVLFLLDLFRRDDANPLFAPFWKCIDGTTTPWLDFDTFRANYPLLWCQSLGKNYRWVIETVYTTEVGADAALNIPNDVFWSRTHFDGLCHPAKQS